MRLRVIAISLLLGLPAFAQTIATNAPMFFIDRSTDTLLIEGTWTLVSKRPSVEMPRVNSVRIECSRHSGICREYAAKLIQPSDGRDVDRTALFLMVQEYTIDSWTSQQIVASADEPAARISLRISVLDQTLYRSSKPAFGPLVQWKLEAGEQRNR